MGASSCTAYLYSVYPYRILIMKQSFASAARLRDGGPILTDGWSALVAAMLEGWNVEQPRGEVPLSVRLQRQDIADNVVAIVLVQDQVRHGWMRRPQKNA